MGKRKSFVSGQLGIDSFVVKSRKRGQRPLSPVQNRASIGETENEFERECAAIKERNAAMMQSLGIPEAAEKVGKLIKEAKTGVRREKKKQSQASSQTPLTRKSYALRSMVKIGPEDVSELDNKMEGDDDESSTVEATVDWDAIEASDVLCYQDTHSELQMRSEATIECHEDVQSILKLPYELHDGNMAKIYTMDTSGTLLAAGGKHGRASIFGIGRLLGDGDLDGDEGSMELEVGPLLSCKLHKGWISQVQFLTTAGGEQLLLSSGNDGVVSVWDTSKVANGMPRKVTTNEKMHSAGIFGMHASQSKLLTASKDFTVALSDLQDPGRVRCVHTFNDIHSGVVKYVQWRDECTFVSCGTDRLIQVVDTRKKSASISIWDSHRTAINFVSVSPMTDNLVLSASYDAILNLHDLRSPMEPLFKLGGHTQVRRCSNIYKPTFWLGGRQIVTGGDKTKMITLYSGETGRRISRGNIGYAPSMLHSFLSGGSMLASARPKSVIFYGADTKATED